MTKTFLGVALALVVLAFGCQVGPPVLQPVNEAELSMATIDRYLDRPGAKYVDLRNVADKYTGGYIDGFEVISFFEYLEGRALTRNDGWNFTEADITSSAILENLFGDKEREVFLMCAAGTRSGYVGSALKAIGYTRVYNVGGLRDYVGEHRVLGDPTFVLELRN